jgi:hypothetical protein
MWRRTAEANVRATRYHGAGRRVLAGGASWPTLGFRWAHGTAATRRASYQTIKAFNDRATEQTQQMVSLTRWIVALTVVMVIAVITQIVLAIVLG